MGGRGAAGKTKTLKRSQSYPSLSLWVPVMPPPLVGLKNVPHFLCAALTFPALGCSFCKPFLVLGREHTSLVFKFRCLYVRKILLNYKELLSPSMLASDKPGCWKIFSGGLDHEVLEKKEVISIKGVTSVF